MAADSSVLMWATAISTHAENGRKIIFRFAEAFSPDFDRVSQPIRIDIVWKYESETGLPITEERERMELLEDTLDAQFNHDGFATLALVSTGENLREWTYYAKSEHEFTARFDYAIADMPELPIGIHATHDPAWEKYDQFRARVKQVKH